MDNSTISNVENKEMFGIQPANIDVDSESSTMVKLEFSEAGEPVPFKIIKLEQDGEPNIFQMELPIQTEWIPDSAGEAGPSSMDNPELNEGPHSSSSPPPNKRMKPETQHVAGPSSSKRHLRLENNESMEVMSSDEDVFSADSDMDYDNDSESDSQYEDISDDDPLGTGTQNDLDQPEPDDMSHQKPDWTIDETSMKNLKFTKNRELLIPPPQDPYESFRWFLNDELLDMLVNETNKYADTVIGNKQAIRPKSRLWSWKPVTREEMITFLALLIHTGTIRTNRIGDYWKEHYLFNLTCFSKFMTLNRFMILLDCLNFAIRPIVENFNKKMNEIYYPGKELAIAKSLVLWQGRLVRQEYTDHRRHKYGVNLSMLTEPNGTVVKYHVCVGNTHDNIFKTGKIVTELLEDNLDNGHSVYMDRNYSSYKLALKLLERQTYCTGTLSKKTRDHPFRTISCDDCKDTNKSFYSKGVHIGKWKDTKSTLYITTEFKNELHPVLLRNGLLKNKPKALINYSKFMTGHELQDQLMSYPPCNRKKMAWYKKVFFHTLQIYMSNAYHLFNQYYGKKKNLGYYEFRLSVLKAMLPESMSIPKSLPKNHTLTKITRTRLREKRLKDGSIRMRKEKVRKDCKICRQKKNRTATAYECTACKGSPGFCTTCFCEFHASTGTPYQIAADEEVQNISLDEDENIPLNSLLCGDGQIALVVKRKLPSTVTK